MAVAYINNTQSTVTCSKSAIETLEEGVKIKTPKQRH